MKHLYLLRGAPGAGKSTLINTYNLQPFTLSSDELRQQFSNTTYNIHTDENGETVVKEDINGKNDKRVWGTLLNMLEARMINGDTTIVDATHTSMEAMKTYNKLVKKYNYRIFTVQLESTLDQLVENNNMRPEAKQVPYRDVKRHYDGIVKTTPKMAKRYNLSQFSSIEEAGEFILTNSTWNTKTIDPDKFDKVYVIGDIHASYGTLEEFLTNYYTPDNYYIFLGDYLDRGLEPVKTVNALYELRNSENIVLLRGNHETNYESWLSTPKRFTPEIIKGSRLTKEQIDQRNKEISKAKKLTRSSMKYIKEVEATLSTEEFAEFTSKLKGILSRLQDVFMFTVNDQDYVCTHGGIVANVLDYNKTGSMINFSTNAMVRGVGTYGDDIDVIFTKQMIALPEEERIIQLHGHRNTFKHEVLGNQYSYNLEQHISDGGYLGVVSVNVHTGEVEDLSIKNTQYRVTLRNTPINDYPISQFYEDAKKDEYIRVKPLKTVDDVYSINFNEKAFYDKVWTGMTVRARGLFINPITEKVIARSYDKFFNLNEQPDATLKNLDKRLTFPVTILSKVNGFLGILTVYQDEFLFLSKSTDDSKFSKLFKDTFIKHTKELGINLVEVKNYIKKNNVSLVFEVIDQEEDPHIIKYENNGVVLLDVFKNQLEEEVLDKHTIPELEKFLVPEERIFTTWEELRLFIKSYNKGVDIRTNPVLEGVGIELDQYNEGYVIRDFNNFRVKVKGAYYNTWKGIRPLIQQALKGKRGRVWNRVEKDFLHYLETERKEDVTASVLTEREEYIKYLKRIEEL